MKQTVYLETTVISYYTAKPSRDLIVAGHQQITTEWWEKSLPKFDCYISEFIIDEAERGDEEASKKRIDVVSQFPLLTVNDEIQKIAQTYFERLTIPEKARLDAAHLAIACYYKMDYLLSWNCKHIVSGKVRMKLQELNRIIQLHTPIICTPEELLEI